jgi:SnoaL-like protein
MSQHLTISPAEAADRLAIRELVEAYAHCADGRDAKSQMALFTADTHLVVHMNAKDPKPSQELNCQRRWLQFCRSEQVRSDHALPWTKYNPHAVQRPSHGETYCMPHHLSVDGNKRRLMIAALRYYDTFVKQDGAWRFAERLLYVDWIEERPLS